jgi:TrmH family RNA methyltransferase
MSNQWIQYKKLNKKNFRKEEKLFLVEGKRLCYEALKSNWEIETAFCNESFSKTQSYNEFVDKLGEMNVSITKIRDTHFKQLADTETPQGILFVMRTPETQNELDTLLKRKKLILVLDGIRDPGNLGTIIRTADWFKVDLIVLSKDTVELFNPKVIRSSMGSIFRIPCIEIEDLQTLMQKLKTNNWQVIGTSSHAKVSLSKFKIKPRVAMILGGEAHGISPELNKIVDKIITIHQFGSAESLNVAVAAGIMMNHISSELYSKNKGS